MIKRWGTCLTKEGVDPDEFWKYHTQIHPPDVMKIGGSGMKRYVMSRVTEVKSGEPRFYDLTEIWWENEEAVNRYYETTGTTRLPDGKLFSEGFASWITDNSSFIVEQFVAKDITTKVAADMQTVNMIKRCATCYPKEGIDPEEFWKYHTQVHAPHILKASSPELKKYIVTRVVKLMKGTEPKFYDFVELWWDKEEEMNKDYETWKNAKLPDGKSLMEDFDSWITSASSFMMEEFIAREYRP